MGPYNASTNIKSLTSITYETSSFMSLFHASRVYYVICNEHSWKYIYNYNIMSSVESKNDLTTRQMLSELNVFAFKLVIFSCCTSWPLKFFVLCFKFCFRIHYFSLEFIIFLWYFIFIF